MLRLLWRQSRVPVRATARAPQVFHFTGKAAPSKYGPAARPPAPKAVADLPLEKEEGSLPAETLSNRQRFKRIPVPNALLERIDRLGFSKTSSKKARERTGRAPYVRPKTLDVKDDSVLGELFLGKNLRLYAKATSLDSLPRPALPEVAFAGRSNVGKSSLLNALTNSKPAEVGDRPGVTRSVNFHELGRKRLAVVDLPGYGFAFAKDEDIASWNELMTHYLLTRETLRRIYLLVDARHGFKGKDRDFLNILSGGRARFQVVLTKCDLVEPLDLGRRVTVMEEELRRMRLAVPTVLMTSISAAESIAAFQTDLARFLHETSGTSGSSKRSGSKSGSDDGPPSLEASDEAVDLTARFLRRQERKSDRPKDAASTKPSRPIVTPHAAVFGAAKAHKERKSLRMSKDDRERSVRHRGGTATAVDRKAKESAMPAPRAPEQDDDDANGEELEQDEEENEEDEENKGYGRHARDDRRTRTASPARRTPPALDSNLPPSGRPRTRSAPPAAGGAARNPGSSALNEAFWERHGVGKEGLVATPLARAPSWKSVSGGAANKPKRPRRTREADGRTPTQRFVTPIAEDGEEAPMTDARAGRGGGRGARTGRLVDKRPSKRKAFMERKQRSRTDKVRQ